MAFTHGRKLVVIVAVAVAALTAAGLRVAVRANSDRPPEFTYATMPDGVNIALAVSFPAGYSQARAWPTLFAMDGYDGGGGPLDPAEWDNRYVMVHASVRGTGCSGGALDLFSWTSALDGTT